MAVNGRNPILDAGLAPSDVVSGKSLYRFDGGFVVVSLSVFKVLADQELTPAALRVLGYLGMICRRSNRIEATQAHVAKALGLDPAVVSRAWRQLREKGFLIRQVECGLSFWYLDARRSFRGSAEAHGRALERQRRQRERDRKSNVVALLSSSAL